MKKDLVFKNGVFYEDIDNEVDDRDMTADEIAYERYKRKQYTYLDYLIVVAQEETYPEKPIGEDKKKYPLFKYYEYELEDDDKPTGGISFNGELLFDFLCETNLIEKENLTLREVNKELKANGIKPLKKKEGK